MSNRITQILTALIIIGFIIRIWGIWNIDYTDEYNEVFEALRVASGRFNTERWIKKFYINILAIEYGIYYVIGYISGIFLNPLDFASKVIRDLSPLLNIARATAVVFSTLSLFMLYKVGEKFYSKEIAIIATTFLTFDYTNVWRSHQANVDSVLGFFVLLSFYFIYHIHKTGRIRYYLLASFFIAVAMSTKTSGVILIIPLIIAHFINWKESKEGILNLFISKKIIYSFLSFVAGLIISNPAILIAFKKFIYSFLWLSKIYTNVYEEVPKASSGYMFYLQSLYENMGMPLFTLAFIGIIYSIIKHRKEDIVILSFCVPFYIILSNSRFNMDGYYLIPIIPFLFLISTRALIELIEKLQLMFFTKHSVKNITLTVLCIILLFIPIKKIYALNLTLLEENTNFVAKKWIEANIPAGSRILIDAGRTIITEGPQISQNRENIIRILNTIKQLNEGEIFKNNPHTQIVDSYSAIYFELLLRNMPEITYDITSTGLGRDLQEVKYYKNNGFEYIIINDYFRNRLKQPEWRAKYPLSAQFYDLLDKEFKVIKTFEPSGTRSGPKITIYKVL